MILNNAEIAASRKHSGLAMTIVTIQSLVVAAAFRLRQSSQAEACGYKIPFQTEGLPTISLFAKLDSIGPDLYYYG